MLRRRYSWLIFSLSFALLAASAWAGRPIKYNKKNPAGEQVSRPETTMSPGGQVIHASETLNRKMLDSKMARANREQAPIAMSEANRKEIKVYGTKEIPMVETRVLTKPGEEVVVTRMSEAEFQAIVKKYQQGMKEPVETLKSGIEVGEDGVSIDEINKYSDPSRGLEKQGIPVEKVGAGDENKD